jgi:hypothetical protein
MSDFSDIGTPDVSSGIENAPATATELGSDYGDTSTSETFTESSDTLASTESAPSYLFEVDGAQITLDEAKNGYLRQADYTRKTQEISEMRSRLSQAEAITAALERDPAATLQALQEAFGLGVSPQADEFADMDPESQRIAAIEARLQAQDDAARQAAIDNQLIGLHEQFGQFDDSELFAHAIRGQFPTLQAAYADLNFGKVQSELSALRSRQQELEARQSAAREAAGVVHDGGARSGSTAPAAGTQFQSIRDAYFAAKSALGG